MCWITHRTVLDAAGDVFLHQRVALLSDFSCRSVLTDVAEIAPAVDAAINIMYVFAFCIYEIAKLACIRLAFAEHRLRSVDCCLAQHVLTAA